MSLPPALGPHPHSGGHEPAAAAPSTPGRLSRQWESGSPDHPYTDPGTRPGVLTVAAVIAIVSGALGIMNGFLGLSNMSRAPGLYTLVVVLSLALSFAVLFAGRKAIKGEDSRWLVIIGVTVIVIRIAAHVWLATSFRVSVSWIDLVDYALLITMIVCSLQPTSRAWIKAKGGSTF